MDGLKHSETVALTALVEYQEGSIVSRTLLKNAAGNLTVFAFGKGQGLSKHSAPFDAFVQVLEGEAEIMIDEKPHPLKGGEAIIMPANIPHAVYATSNFKMLLVMIKG